jgi:uncharacterized C2H2 Zn-finger protein
MVKYECKICKLVFNKKYNFIRHENKKYKCEASNINLKSSTENTLKSTQNTPKSTQNTPKSTQNTLKTLSDTSENNKLDNLYNLDNLNDSDNSDYMNNLNNLNNLDNSNNFNNLDNKNYLDNNKDNINNISILDKLEFQDDLNKIKCGYCQTSFTRKTSLKRHLDTSCKVKKQQDKEKEEIFKQLLIKDTLLKEKEEQINKKDEQLNLKNEQITLLVNKIGILEKKIDKIFKSKSNKSINSSNSSSNSSSSSNSNNNIITNCNNSTTNNNTNTTNTSNVVFQLVNYGKEDLDKIDVKDFFNAIVKNNKVCGVKIPEEILKLIHFNSNYPELNNIYISDINREKCMIYDDGMWKLSPDDKIPEVIDKVVKFSYKKQDVLREKFADNKPIIDRLNVINKYTQFNDSEYLEGLKYDDEYNSCEDDKPNNINQIKRCEDFQKKTYNTFKTTMYNEGIKIKKNKANKN